MGLRKLTDKPASQADQKHAERLEREAAEAAVRRYQDGQRPAAPAHSESSSAAYRETADHTTTTGLQTPPPSHKEFTDEPEAHNEPAPAPVKPAPPAPVKAEEPKKAEATPTPTNTTDSFAAALEALRATLRQPAPAPRPDSRADIAEEAPGPVPTPDTPIEMEAPEPAESLPPPVQEHESASALERMPLPPTVEGPAQTPRPLYEDPLLKVQRRKVTPVPVQIVNRETPTIDSALQAVRNAVPGLRVTPPKSDTPVNGRETPLSDGIPKSISEDLPKYSAKPKMRICGRCGHETKLRNSKCEKCAHVDESLGILDAVIAGDLVRVEHVLLVRPGLITLRTSRHEWTLLHMAASGGNPKMVDLLLAKGASVNAANRDGKTALHYAAGKGHLGIVKTLLNHHADPTILYNGRSALDLARKAGHHEVADTIRVVMPEGDPDA